MEKEVKIDVLNGTLVGSLIVPTNSKKPTIVLIIAGSGPTNRNGNNMLAGETNNLKQLAYELANKNVVSLRFDKRGVGGSKSAIIPEEKLKLQTFVDDVLAWLTYIHESCGFGKVFVLGHSEGRLIAIKACQKFKVAGCILMATLGQKLAQVLEKQLRQQLASQPSCKVYFAPVSSHTCSLF